MSDETGFEPRLRTSSFRSRNPVSNSNLPVSFPELTAVYGRLGRDGIRTTVAAKLLPDSNPARSVNGLASLGALTGETGFEPAIRRLGTSCPLR